MEFYPAEFPGITEATTPVGGDIDTANPTSVPATVVLGDIESHPSLHSYQIGKMWMQNFVGVDCILNNLPGIGFATSDETVGTWPTLLEVRTTDPLLDGTLATIHYEAVGGALISESITLSDSSPYPLTSSLAASFVRLDLPLPTTVAGNLEVYRDSDGGFIGYCASGSSTVYGHIYFSEDGNPGTSADTIVTRLDSGAYFTQAAGFPRVVPSEFTSLNDSGMLIFVGAGEEVAIWVFSLIFPGLPARPSEDLFVQWDGEEDLTSDSVFVEARFSFGQTSILMFGGNCTSRYSTTYGIAGSCKSRYQTAAAIEGHCLARYQTDNSIAGRCKSRFSTTNAIEGHCKNRFATSQLVPITPGLHSPICSPAVFISGPIPTTDIVKTVSITEQTDGGWKVTINLIGFFDVTTLNKSDLWIIHVLDRGTGVMIKLPPMVILASQESTLETCSGTPINLQDEATYKAAEKKINLPTFINQTSGTILAAAASAAGVTVSGSTSWTVNQEDLKDVKVLAVLKRYGKAQGKDLSVTITGEFVYSSACDMDTPAPAWLPQKITVGIDWTKKKGKLNISKTSPINEGDQVFSFDTTGQHYVSLSRPIHPQSIPVDESAKDFIGFVGFWQGDPQAAGTLRRRVILGFTGQIISPVPVVPGGGQITHLTVYVQKSQFAGPREPADATVRIISAPATPPPGTEYEFNTSIGTGDPEESIDEPMWPSEAFVQANKANILCLLQKGFRKIDVVGPLNLGLRTRQKFESQFDDARIETVTHSIAVSSNSSSTTAINCNIPQDT